MCSRRGQWRIILRGASGYDSTSTAAAAVATLIPSTLY